MFNFSLVQRAFNYLYLGIRNEDEEEGQGLVEYALILVLISVVAIAIMTTVGGKVSGVFSSISTGLDGATT